MWSAIKNLAAKIFGGGSKPKSSGGGIVATFNNPNMGQLTPTYNPQGNNSNPQGSNYNPQGSNYNPQGGAVNPQGSNSYQVAAANQQLRIQQEAIARKQEAQRAAQAQQNSLANVWRGFLNGGKKTYDTLNAAIHAPGNIYWTMKDRQRQKNDMADAQANDLAWINGRRRKADATVAQAGKDLSTGQISVDDYNAIVKHEQDTLVKHATFLNQDLQSRQDQVNAPVQGRSIDAIKKLGSFLNPLGKVTSGAFNVLSNVVEAPQRALNTVWNVTHPNRAIETNNFAYKKPPTYTEWVSAHGGKGNNEQLAAWQKSVKQDMAKQMATQPKVQYKGNFIDKLGQAWNASKDQRVTRGNPYTPALGWLGNQLADPINYLPAGWASKGAKLVKETKAGAFIGKGLTATGDVASKIPGASKVIQAGKWLNAPVMTGNAKFLDKYINKANKDFAGLTPGEVQAYQDIMKNGGKVPEGYKMVSQGDLNKVVQFASGKKSTYDAMLAAERAKGIETPYRFGYVPSKRDLRGIVDTKDLTPSNTPSFLRAKRVKDGYLKTHELAFADAYRQYENSKVLKKLPNQRFLSTDTTNLRRKLSAPNRLWKTAVLRYNPAWYVHNLGWNIPASFMAGGARTAGAYAKLGKAAIKERTLNPAMLDKLPKGAIDKGWFAMDQGGKAGKLTLGTKIENLSRAAGYMGARGKGQTEAQAVKSINSTMFDYGDVRNWERPALAALPFWRFQKNITRLTAGMPFTHPRWANAFNQFHKKFVEQPYNNMPDAPQQTFNPETGQPENVNIKERYKGKTKTPWGWSTNPFLPVLPESLAQVGVNPLFSLAERAATGKDYFGNSVRGESFGDFFGSAIPQYRVGKAIGDVANGNGNNVERWLSDTGYTKEAQGYDPSKPNYKPSIDPVNTLKKSLRSFVGLPNFTPDIDWNKYRKDQNYYAFSQAYFGTDWKKQYPDYDKREQARKDMAQRYGFDLQKDLYDGRWSKYDSPETTKIKEGKKAVIAMQDQVYKLYNQLPKGSGNNGARGKFIQMWKQIMGNTDFLDKNPGFMVFKNVPVSGDMQYAGSKYAPSTKFSASGASDGNYGGKSGKGASSGFWQAYYASSTAKKQEIRSKYPQYFKKYAKNYDPKKSDITWAYKNLPPDVRRAYLNKKYGKASAPAEGWDAYLAARGLDFNSKLGRDLIIRPDLGTKQLDKVNEIVGSYAKPLPTGKGATFIQPRRRPVTFGKKRLTFKV